MIDKYSYAMRVLELIGQYPDLRVEILGEILEAFAETKDIDQALNAAICEWDL